MKYAIFLFLGALVILAGNAVYQSVVGNSSGGTTSVSDPRVGTKDDQKSQSQGNIYTSSQYQFQVVLPDAWENGETGNGLKFGTKLENYGYTDTNDAYGTVLISIQKSDYGKGAPGLLKTTQNTSIDSNAAVKKVFEGEGDPEIVAFPLTRLEIYDLERNGKFYHIEFAAAVANQSAWDEFAKLISSWRWQ